MTKSVDSRAMPKTTTLALLLALALPASFAAPFTPKSDSEVVEKLPSTANDPSVRRVDSLRKQLAARPNDSALRLEIAQRYFDLAMAQGDPRYVGYAQAALIPLAQTSANNADYWQIRGMLEQYSHDFPGAMKSLEKASQLDPQAANPIAWRAAIDMVEARYADALAECTRLVPLTHPLFAQGCTAYVQANTGHLQAAYESLDRELKAAGDVAPGLVLWVETRLGEMAIRLQKFPEAEAHYLAALKLGITDQYLLGAYSDFLLLQKRPAEVVKLLADWERSDILLLRLALAGKDMNHAKAADWASQLRERFIAAAQRGDRLHEQEAARFELFVEGHPQKALDYAVRNYGSQKEARDADILMQAALAANQPKAAQPALDWLRENHYEDPALAQLAGQLVAKGAAR
jgi:tetratricopeptide (TPR) repeat protein